MALAAPDARDVLRHDWSSISQALHSHLSPQRHTSAARTWQVWERFCNSIGVRPDLLDVPGDLIPVLLLFAQRYRSGTIAPRDKPVRSRTVEDALRHIAQTFARVGSPDPRLNSFGTLDFRLQALFSAWKKLDPLPHASNLYHSWCSARPTHQKVQYCEFQF